MGKRRSKGRERERVPTREQPAAFNNPFAALSDLRKDLPTATMPKPPARGASIGRDAVSLADPHKVTVQSERAGRAGKTVTRIKGLPKELIPELRRRMPSALGCGATEDDGDLLLLGDLVDRAARWLEREGARQVVVSGRAGSRRQPTGNTRPMTSSEPPMHAGPGGTKRAEIVPGLTVDVVLKADQPTGALSRGVVKDVLTRSATHPHGIKVRLADGRVGRVKQIIGEHG